MSRMRINGLQTEVNFYKAICCYYFSMPLQNFDKYIVIASRYQLFTYLVALYTCMSSEKYFKSWILRVWLNSIVVVIWFCLVRNVCTAKMLEVCPLTNKQTHTFFFSYNIVVYSWEVSMQMKHYKGNFKAQADLCSQLHSVESYSRGLSALGEKIYCQSLWTKQE